MKKQNSKLPHKVAMAIKLKEEKLSYGAIARRLGISRTRAHQYCNQDPSTFKGVPGRPKGTCLALTRDQVVKARITYFYSPHPPSVEMLAERYNVSRGAMYRALHGQGAYGKVE